MSWLHPKSLIVRLALWLSIIFIVWFLILGWNAWKIQQAVKRHGLETVTDIVRYKSNALHMYSEGLKRSLNNLSQLIMIAEYHHRLLSDPRPNAPSRTFDASIERFIKANHLYDILLLSPSGDIIYSFRKESTYGINITKDVYAKTPLYTSFSQALHRLPPKLSAFSYFLPSSNNAAFISSPIISNGKVLGVLTLQIQNKDLHQILGDYSLLRKTGDIEATVLRGENIVYMAPTRFGDNPAYSSKPADRASPEYYASTGHQGAGYIQTKRGKTKVAAWTYNSDLQWGIVATIDENEILSQWSLQNRYIIVEMFVLFFIVIALIAYVLQTIRKPLETIIEGTKAFSEGEFETTIILDNTDEFGTLADTFNMMAERICNDITQLNEKNRRLTEQKNKISKFNEELEFKINQKIEQLSEYIKIVDENVITSTTNIHGMITYVSQAFTKISGYSAVELIGKSHSIIRHPDMPDSLFHDLWATITAGKTWHGEIKNRNKNGGFYWVDTVITPNFKDGILTGYTSIRQDITDRKRVEELAITDPLTGLYNRRHFLNVVERELKRAIRYTHTLTIVMIDIDCFKQYNDTYGHLAGDDVLIKVSQVLKEHAMRASDYAFRLGGEEFAILLIGMSSERASDFAEMIRKSVEDLKLEHKENLASPYVTISVGIAIEYGKDIASFDEFFKTADDNLYLSKANGRNKVTL